MKKNNIEIQPKEFNVGIQPMKYQYRNPTNEISISESNKWKTNIGMQLMKH